MNLRKKILISFVLISGLIYCQTSSNRKIQDLESRLKDVQSTNKVDVLNELSFLYYRESVPVGRDYAAKAYSLAVQIKYLKGEAVSLRNIGFGLYLGNKLDTAVVLYRNSMAMLERIGDIKEKAICQNYSGLIFWRRGLLQKAFENYRKAQKLAEQAGDSLEIARSLNYIGLIYWKWSDYSLSMDYFTQALKIKEAQKDIFEITVTLNNIAFVDNELKDYKESLKYSNRALKLAEDNNDKYGLGRAYNSIGVSHYKLKNFEKAKEVQLKSLEIKESSGDLNGISYSYTNLAEIYNDLKNYNKSVEYYEKALSIKEKLKDNYGMSSVLNGLGNIYLKLGNFKSAAEYFTKSQHLAVNEKIKEVEKNNYLSLANLYEAQKDYKKSLENYKLYNELKDSIYTKETRDKLAELRINFESENKEKEIALLTKENELRQLQINKQSQRYNILITFLLFGILIAVVYFYYQNKRKQLLMERNKNIEKHAEELKELNASKDKFFSIVAHDLKSPFHGLLGFSNLLLDELDTLSTEQIRRYVKNIKTSTKNVYELIENLLDWSRIQIGRVDFNPMKIDVKEEANNVFGLLQRSADKKEITYRNNLSGEIFVNADKKMLHSILQNLFSNAIKFSYKGGTIKINSKELGELVELQIADNGIGISKDNIDKIFEIGTQFTTVGTADEKGTGLGLLLCKEMVEKHGGMIRVQSELKKGTTFIFTLPKYSN